METSGNEEQVAESKPGKQTFTSKLDIDINAKQDEHTPSNNPNEGVDKSQSQPEADLATPPPNAVDVALPPPYEELTGLTQSTADRQVNIPPSETDAKTLDLPLPPMNDAEKETPHSETVPQTTDAGEETPTSQHVDALVTVPQVKQEEGAISSNAQTDGDVNETHSQSDARIDILQTQTDNQVQFRLEERADNSVKPSKPARKIKTENRPPTLEQIASTLNKLVILFAIITVVVIILDVCFISLQHTTHTIGKDLSESKAATSDILDIASRNTKALNDTRVTVEKSNNEFRKMAAQLDTLRRQIDNASSISENRFATLERTENETIKTFKGLVYTGLGKLAEQLNDIGEQISQISGDTASRYTRLKQMLNDNREIIIEHFERTIGNYSETSNTRLGKFEDTVATIEDEMNKTQSRLLEAIGNYSEKVEERLEKIEDRLASIEHKMNKTYSTLPEPQLGEKLEKIKDRLASIDDKMNKTYSRLPEPQLEDIEGSGEVDLFGRDLV